MCHDLIKCLMCNQGANEYWAMSIFVFTRGTASHHLVLPSTTVSICFQHRDGGRGLTRSILTWSPAISMKTVLPSYGGGPLAADTEQIQLSCSNVLCEVFLPGYEVYECTQTWCSPRGNVTQKQTRNVPVHGTDLSVSWHSELRVYQRVNR